MQHRNAFTLIELLVVVLIIAILAAVALPQYTKAVERARASEAMTMLKALTTAQQAYFMQNDTYTRNLEELPVEAGGYTVLVVGSPAYTILKGKYFNIQLDASGTHLLASPNSTGCSPTLSASSCYDIVIDIDTQELLCYNGTVTPLKKKCSDIGFNKAKTGCSWPNCLSM